MIKYFFFSLVSQAQQNTITGVQAIDKDDHIFVTKMTFYCCYLFFWVVGMQLLSMIYICMLHAKYVLIKFYFLILYDNFVLLSSFVSHNCKNSLIIFKTYINEDKLKYYKTYF